MTETEYTIDEETTIQAHADAVCLDDGTTRWIMSPEYAEELSVILAAAAKDAREIAITTTQEVPC